VIPHFVQATHIPFPPELQQRLLPGTVYVLSNDASGATVLPDGWEKTTVEARTSTQHYGRLHKEFAAIREIATVVSPDLRMYANVLNFSSDMALAVPPRSSLASIAQQSDKNGFSLFHFYRPNRAATEVSKTFEKFYEHIPSTDVVSSLAAAGSSW